MRALQIGSVAALAVVALAADASATPNMIRLGYPTCTSCHLTPQGAGLLTTYGVGIDAAQSRKPEEVEQSDLTEAVRRLAYDVRFSVGVDREPPDATGYSFNTSVRSALHLGSGHRIVYAASVASPTLQRSRTMGAASIRMSRLYWLYQPSDGLVFTVGRDDTPTGLGLPGAASYARRVNSPSVSSTPTQAKVFWWNKRWQVTSYAFGPDGNETAPRFEAYGGGALIGADIWKNRAVIGMTAKTSYADAYDRRSAGAFLRLGLTKHWGVLLEHDFTDRTTSKPENFSHVSGHSEVFFVPFDWLQTSLGGDHVKTRGGDYSFRLNPSAKVRLNRNISVSFDTEDSFTGTGARSRVYSFQVMVKRAE